MSTKRERVYDDEISPLIAKVVAICKEHDIPMVASFQLNDDREGLSDTNDDGEDLGPFFCTSILTSTCSDGLWSHTHQQLLHAGKILAPKQPSWAAYTVTGEGSERVAGSSDGYDPGAGR